MTVSTAGQTIQTTLIGRALVHQRLGDFEAMKHDALAALAATGLGAAGIGPLSGLLGGEAAGAAGAGFAAG